MAQPVKRRLKRVETKINQNSDRVSVALDEILPKVRGEHARLHSAMRYSALKRADGIRSTVIFEIGKILKLNELSLLRLACAVECAHAHFAIHEDLPQLGNNVKRSGWDSLHIEFDEGTAVLAGNALMSMAIEIISDNDTHEDPQIRCALIQHLAEMTGPRGFASLGNRFNVAAEYSAAAANLNRIHNAGRAAVMAFAARAPFILANQDSKLEQAFTAYSKDIALSKRLKEEIVVEQEKSTEEDESFLLVEWEDCTKSYAALLGLDAAMTRAKFLAEQAKTHLEPFGRKADPLRRLADYVLAE